MKSGLLHSTPNHREPVLKNSRGGGGEAGGCGGGVRVQGGAIMRAASHYKRSVFPL